jgi:phenylpropionate dioxygenase-like ring-hydroxylating dioxygenase large terminal subunit
MVCPFHGWVYNLDGTLRGAARAGSFGDLNKADFGLKPVESGIWHGFIFVRFKPGPQGTLDEAMAPYDEDLKAYRFEDLVPARKSSAQEIPVNWKSVRDVDNEGYHVAMAHPALQDLYGPGYIDLFLDHGRTISFGPLTPGHGRRWSVRNYLKFASDHDWLPEGKRRLWSYFGLFPNAVLAVTPESVQFYHEFPLGVDRTLLKGRSYRRREENRQQRVARYLAGRIDNETYKEDIQLSIWSNEAMKSSAFDKFHLSDLEYGVKNHHDELRRLLPVLWQDAAPSEAEMADLNAAFRNVLSD